MKKLLTLIVMMIPMGCAADNTACKYDESFIKEVMPNNKDILKSYWKKGIDPDSSEYTARLYLILKNGDIAVLEHKYCDMYNFELTYLVDKNTNGLTKDSIGNLVKEYANLSQIKPSYKIKLNQIVSSELLKNKFQSDSALSIGLPVDQIKYNDNVEYGLSYQPGLEGFFSTNLNFY